ncbi:MAG: pantoate--beta-alanine ligase [Syntrophobacteraceae bacterium]
MRIIDTICEMQQQADIWRRERKRIVFVPTMGYLHDGHLTLMQAAREQGDVVVVSIFVNPTQFGPGEDFQRYPRDLERDIRLMAGVGVDVVFTPTAEEMYPEGHQTYIEVTEVTKSLCGESRPGHFRGVATVVTILFNIVKPHVAIFGAKDFQQQAVIKRMVQDLHLDVDVIAHPTVREVDGLAMSSRNTYLNPEERQTALHLSRSLGEAQSLIDSGERNSEVILEKVREVIEAGPGARLDYARLCRPDTLEDVSGIDSPTLLALAVFVGKTRLIDNTVLQLCME